MGRGTRIILGLNSGTSADGVDAVACEIAGRGLRMRVRVIGHLARRYPPALRQRLLNAMAPANTQTQEICRLDREVGLAFARTARAAVKRFGLRRVDLVGSHGQTVCHLPSEGWTMQIGDASPIAAAIGAPVVSRFRQADMAVGGQGAPLVPWTDYVLFGRSKRGRVVQNLGGIANLTWLPAGGATEDVLAFDTGPGNMLIDALVSHFTRGARSYDRGGRLARGGKVRPDILSWMLDHPFLSALPPKSCGREEFGAAFVRAGLRKFKRRRVEDWLATATRFTATTIASAYALYLGRPKRAFPPMDEVILCGGGAKNRTLVEQIKAAVTFDGQWDHVRWTTTADYGIPTQAKEGVSFAMLAAACADGVRANLPQVTGARRGVVLGQVCDLRG